MIGGVPAKGMQAWGARLGPERLEDVAAYVLTLRDTEVPGKAPEGEIWKEPGDRSEGTASGSPDSATSRQPDASGSP